MKVGKIMGKKVGKKSWEKIWEWERSPLIISSVNVIKPQFIIFLCSILDIQIGIQIKVFKNEQVPI